MTVVKLESVQQSTFMVYIPLDVFNHSSNATLVESIKSKIESIEASATQESIEASATPESTEASATPESIKASAMTESNLESKLESIEASATHEFQARFDQTKHAGGHTRVQAWFDQTK